MASARPVDRTVPASLLPAGQRWGRGTTSITPYLRDALAARPRNAVFTPAHYAAQVWPVPTGRAGSSR